MNILKKCRRALATLLAVGTAFVATAAWAATPLSAPTWTMHSVKNTEIKLEWGAVDNALNYTLFYKESTADKFRQYAVVATNSTTYYGVKDKTYEFYLVANPKAGKDLEKSAASETKTILLNEEANPKEPLPTPTWTMHSVKNTEIKLEWSKVEDALNYTLYYKESTSDKFLQRVVATTSTTYYGVKDKTYDFFVVANPKYNDGYDVSAASETKTILLNEEANPKDALPTPTWVMTSVKNTEIKLEWSKVEDALNYTLYYKESTSDKFLQRVVATTSTTYYGIKDLSYDFFVVANPKYNDGYDVSAASETKTIALGDNPVPPTPTPTPTPTAPSVSGGRLSDDKTAIKLEWTAVDGATEYAVYWVLDPKAELDATNCIEVATTDAETLTVTLPQGEEEGYDVNATHYFVVSAKLADETYLDSEPFEVGVVSEDEDKLATPTNLKAEVDGATIKLTWSKVDNAGSYKLEWKEAEQSDDKYASISVENNAYDFQNGEKGKTYVFRVAAISNSDDLQDSDYSTATQATIPNDIDEPVPTNTVFLKGYPKQNGNAIKLKWAPFGTDDSTSSTSYTVWYKDLDADADDLLTGGLGWQTASAWGSMDRNTGEWKDVEHTLQDLKWGHTYKVYVSNDNSDEEEKNAENKGVDITLKLAAPTNVTITADGYGAWITWDKVEGADGYAIFACEGSKEEKDENGKTKLVPRIEWVDDNIWNSNGWVEATLDNKKSEPSNGKAYIKLVSGVEGWKTWWFTVVAKKAKSTAVKDWFISDGSGPKDFVLEGRATSTQPWPKPSLGAVYAGNSKELVVTVKYKVPEKLVSDHVICAYQYKRSDAKDWGEEHYIVDESGEWMKNGWFSIFGLENNVSYDIRVRIIADEIMNNQGYTHSDWSETMTKMVEIHNYAPGAATFVDYNIMSGSYYIRW